MQVKFRNFGSFQIWGGGEISASLLVTDQFSGFVQGSIGSEYQLRYYVLWYYIYIFWHVYSAQHLEKLFPEFTVEWKYENNPIMLFSYLFILEWKLLSQKPERRSIQWYFSVATITEKIILIYGLSNLVVMRGLTIDKIISLEVRLP